MRVVVKVPLYVEVDTDRLKPRGPVERRDDGSPDVETMLRIRLLDAFRHVEGYDGARTGNILISRYKDLQSTKRGEKHMGQAPTAIAENATTHDIQDPIVPTSQGSDSGDPFASLPKKADPTPVADTDDPEQD